MKDYKRMKTKQIRLTGGQSEVRSLDQGGRSLICSPKMRIGNGSQRLPFLRAHGVSDTL